MRFFAWPAVILVVVLLNNAAAISAQDGPQRQAQIKSDETVSFGGDIAPVLVEHCTGCHGTDRPRGGLSMATFERLIDGGDSGPIVVPGNPAESLLIGKLKGTADGARMPNQRPALASKLIERIETWIAEGATFDGSDPPQPLARLVEIILAGKLSHDELAAKRMEIAARNWRLALPDESSRGLETDNLHLVGNVSGEFAERIAALAETQRKKVAKILKAPAGKPLIKGKLTLFVFNRRYDYAEFGQMVEGRRLPPGQTGHWRQDALDAYACIVRPRGGKEEPLAAQLTMQLAGLYVAGQGNVPRWFAEGCSRVVAARCHPRDARVRTWQRGVPAAITSAGDAEKFLASDVAAGDFALVGYGFAAHLMSNSRRFHRLMRELRKGGDFDPSFAAAYGADPKTHFTDWATRIAAGR